MKNTLLALSILLLAVASHWAFAGDVWRLAERHVPLPAAASEQLRRSIDATPVPDKDSRQFIPTSTEEWLSAQQQDDNISAAGITKLANLFKVEIERDNIGGVGVARISPTIFANNNRDRLFVVVHGGAYIYGAGDAGLTEGIVIANRIGIPVLSIDYRMPPTHPFPAAIDDVVTVYRHLIKSHSPGTMIIGGTSAGGGLALASVHKFRQLDLPTPAAVYAGTAWADLTKTGDTLYTNEGLDQILVTYDGSLAAAAKLYAGDHDMKDPLISPVYGDFNNFPPVILVTGTRDMFLSDVTRTHRKLRAAGVDADLHVYEGMSHAGYIFVMDSPESLDMYAELSKFVDKHVNND
jgi:acetyl esterase/lipase